MGKRVSGQGRIPREQGRNIAAVSGFSPISVNLAPILIYLPANPLTVLPACRPTRLPSYPPTRLLNRIHNAVNFDVTSEKIH